MAPPVSSSPLKGVANNYNNQLLSSCSPRDRGSSSPLLSPGICCFQPFCWVSQALGCSPHHSCFPSFSLLASRPSLPLPWALYSGPALSYHLTPSPSGRKFSKLHLRKEQEKLTVRMVRWVQGQSPNNKLFFEDLIYNVG